MGDFDFGTAPPGELSSTLRTNGIVPAEAVDQAAIDPDRIGLLKGWHGPADPDRAQSIARRHGRDLMPILVVDRGGGSYETVNGVHRVEAARILGMNSVHSLVVQERVFDLLFREYGEVAMERWAHKVASTGWDS